MKQKLSWLLVGILLLTNILTFSAMKQMEIHSKANSELYESTSSENRILKSINEVLNERLQNQEAAPKQREVIFTSYYVGDGSSGLTTSSGIDITKFEINEDGFYTYDGKVVIATANVARLNKPLKDGYYSHEIGEELVIELYDKQYQSIVLDVCGACYGVDTEDIQRYDIFTDGTNLGTIHGYIEE